MATSLLKRLLLATLVLWSIATAVFLISKVMPGTYGSEQLNQADPGYYSRGDATVLDRAYREFLRSTNQDLPLFYFSVASGATPDTLHRVFPMRDRLFLERLALRYGDPRQATLFFRNLKGFETAIAEQQRTILQPYLYAIYQHTQPVQLQHALQALDTLPLAPTSDTQKQRMLADGYTLLNTSIKHRYLQPAFQWHGLSNQYHLWFSGMAKGNWGISLRDGRPVAQVLYEAIGNTWWLLLASMVFASLLAMELALLMIRRAGRKWRQITLPFLFLLDSIPVFVLAILLLVLLASPAFLQLFPVYGMGYHTASEPNLFARMSQWLQYMALPMISLVLVNLPYLTNQFYHALKAVSEQDYIRTARAKGLSESAVIRRHMLRNALLPVITLLSDFLPALVAGAVIIETIFAIPGVGRLLIDSVLARDYPVIVGIVVVIALFKLLSHLLADLLYHVADPRLRQAAR
ncbi:ABC transporter permease [uncultured Pontibacter sp.]|uniref:ABC transporter permease n=1 Tax=uncultured Pontibacter sp. TaxID=453356 RepID=UPI0026044C28|nr:ABC transporter permease [uncultured Pontibacter sp.]